MNQGARLPNWRYVGIFVPATAGLPPMFMEKSCQFFGISEQLVASKTQKREVVNVRQMMWSWLRENTGMSWSEISLAVGRRDHSSAVAGVGVHYDMMQIDKDWRARYESYCKHMEGVVA